MFVAIKAGLPKRWVLAVGSLGFCAYLTIGRPTWFWESLHIQGMRRVLGGWGVTLLYLGAGLLLAWLSLSGGLSGAHR